MRSIEIMIDADYIIEGLGYFNLIPSCCLAIDEETNVEETDAGLR